MNWIFTFTEINRIQNIYFHLYYELVKPEIALTIKTMYLIKIILAVTKFPQIVNLIFAKE